MKPGYIVLTGLLIVSIAGALFLVTTSQAERPKQDTAREAAVKAAGLTDLQYYVTQKDGTEPPFDNAYWDNSQPGIYVDIVSGEPLFSSSDKFKSSASTCSCGVSMTPG